jgi:hypothetical protein
MVPNMKSKSLHGRNSSPAVLTIHEDDAPPDMKKAKAKFRRCMSLPETMYDAKSIMKFRTLDQSLHSTYGPESGGGGAGDRVVFRNVEIREYGRTIGDNPSCSAGPPVG